VGNIYMSIHKSAPRQFREKREVAGREDCPIKSTCRELAFWINLNFSLNKEFKCSEKKMKCGRAS
jgi:hypothetical protein